MAQSNIVHNKSNTPNQVQSPTLEQCSTSPPLPPLPQRHNNKCLYVLTRDECFYVISANILKYSKYLNELAKENKSFGTYFYPIFLQKVIGKTFQAILHYVEYLDNNCTKDTDMVVGEINDILSQNFKNNDIHHSSHDMFTKEHKHTYLTFIEAISYLELPIKHDILMKIGQK